MKPLHLLLALFSVTVLSSNFVSSKFALAYFPPIYFTALRFLFAGLILIPLVKFPRGEMKRIFTTAIISGLNFWLTIAGLAHGLSIATCIITIQLAVPVACILSAILLRDPLGIWRSAGMAVAFIGIVIVAGAPNAAANPFGFMLALGGAVSGGVLNIALKKCEHIASWSLLAWMTLFSGLQLLALSLATETEQWELLTQMPATPFYALAYTTLLTTIVAYGLWCWLLRHNPVTSVAPFSLLSPFIGTALGQWFFHEELSDRVLWGGVVVVLGVAVIVLRRPKLAG